jgi:hypothetical protein
LLKFNPTFFGDFHFKYVILTNSEYSHLYLRQSKISKNRAGDSNGRPLPFNMKDYMKTKYPHFQRLFLLAFSVSCILHISCSEPVKLPYDHNNAVIYDNDSPEDVYTDEILFALHTQGLIQLRGIITTNGGWRDDWDDSDFIAEHMIAAREDLVGKARRSGMTDLPEPTRGPKIEVKDTTLNTPGARLIVQLVREANKPLVFICGGPVTALADAYLLDASIRDKVVVAWNGDQTWNSEARPFLKATEIVMQNFVCVLFDNGNKAKWPVVPKEKLPQLPDTELSRFMIDKKLPHVKLPGSRDVDTGSVIPLITPHYVTGVKRLRWVGRTADGRFQFEEDPNGRIWRVTKTNQTVATKAWWRLMTDPKSYGGNPEAPENRPYRRIPQPIPGKIEAEHFDYGGQFVAYIDKDKKSWSDTKENNITIFRPLEHVDFTETKYGNSGYAITKTEQGEWIEYSVFVKTSGKFSAQARIASINDNGKFHIEFDGEKVTNTVSVPKTGGEHEWRVITFSNIQLKSGHHVMRIYIESGGFNLDYVEFHYAEDFPKVSNFRHP